MHVSDCPCPSCQINFDMISETSSTTYTLNEMGTTWWYNDYFMNIHVDHTMVPVFTNEVFIRLGFLF